MFNFNYNISSKKELLLLSGWLCKQKWSSYTKPIGGTKVIGSQNKCARYNYFIEQFIYLIIDDIFN